jgi:hypothetical protein
MTKKDFELIARTMRGQIETADAMYEEHGARALRACCVAFADELEAANPRFDRTRFLGACGAA